VRLSITLLVLALAVLLAGALLIGAGVAAAGGTVVVGGLCLGGWALFRDDGTGPVPREVRGAPTLAEILERARAS